MTKMITNFLNNKFRTKLQQKPTVFRHASRATGEELLILKALARFKELNLVWHLRKLINLETGATQLNLIILRGKSHPTIIAMPIQTRTSRALSVVPLTTLQSNNKWQHLWAEGRKLSLFTIPKLTVKVGAVMLAINLSFVRNTSLQRRIFYC